MQQRGESPVLFPWWDAKDDLALLRAYHERGLYLHGAQAFKYSKSRFAWDLMNDSHTTVDFTVQVSQQHTSCCAFQSGVLSNL